MKPEVVNVRRDKEKILEAHARGEYVYIGRGPCPVTGQRGPWGNPFVEKTWKGEGRDEVIRKYNEWIETQPELKERARKELKGKMLGCWCKPLACHGDTLLKIANEE